MPQKKKAPKMSGRKLKNVPVSQQLRGMKCDHPARNREIVTNSKGKQFKECNACGAFLGWV